MFLPSSQRNALFFADIIKQAVHQLQLEHKYSDVAKHITVSMGLVSYRAQEITSIEDMYKQADTLLYEAKSLGRDQLVAN